MGDAVSDDGGDNGVEEIKRESGFNKDNPPEDDCCPICFGEFNIPCKANCGHWFCGGCILQLWEYQYKPKRCRCPFCNSAISHLTAQLSSVDNTNGEISEVLKHVQQFNGLYAEGLNGVFLRLKFYLWELWLSLLRIPRRFFTFPGRVIVGLVRHPERIRQNYQQVRVLVSFLAATHFVCTNIFPPVPRGRFRFITPLTADVISAIVVSVIYLLSLCVKWITLQWVRFQLWITLQWMRFQIWNMKRREAALRQALDALRAQKGMAGPLNTLSQSEGGSMSGIGATAE